MLTWLVKLMATAFRNAAGTRVTWRIPYSAGVLRRRSAFTLIPVLGLAACESGSLPRSIDGDKAAGVATGWSSEPIDGFHIVDCQFPGRAIRLAGGTPILVPGRITRTTAEDCTDNLGRYIVYDPSNFQSLLSIWLPKAEAGDAEAQTYAGDIYRHGLDGQPDYAKAATWYRRAAQLDYEPAKMRLSDLFEKGLGVPRDRDRAVSLVQEATGMTLVEAMAPGATGEDTITDGYADAAPPADQAEAVRIERELHQSSVEITVQQQRLLQREVELEAARAQLAQQQAAAKADDAADLAEIDDLKSTIAGLENTLRNVQEELADNRTQIMRDRQTLSTAEKSNGEDSMFDLLRDFDFGVNHALVIGNSSYPGFAGGRLETAVNDAEAVTELLQDHYGYDVTPLYDATRDQILNALRILKEELGPSHNLVVYYAGHGEFRNDQGYWLANDLGEDPNATIPTSEITGILRSMAAKHVIVISDSCYARALIEDNVRPSFGVTGPAKEAWIRTMSDRRIRIAFTSGGLKPVLDNGGGRHSIFAASLLKELGTNQDIMEGSRLFLSVAASVQQAAKDLRLEQKPTYSPIKMGDDVGGDYFFVPRNG